MERQSCIKDHMLNHKATLAFHTKLCYVKVKNVKNTCIRRIKFVIAIFVGHPMTISDTLCRILISGFTEEDF